LLDLLALLEVAGERLVVVDALRVGFLLDALRVCVRVFEADLLLLDLLLLVGIVLTPSLGPAFFRCARFTMALLGLSPAHPTQRGITLGPKPNRHRSTA